jgi:hypothetical protein
MWVPTALPIVTAAQPPRCCLSTCLHTTRHNTPAMQPTGRIHIHVEVAAPPTRPCSWQIHPFPLCCLALAATVPAVGRRPSTSALNRIPPPTESATESDSHPWCRTLLPSSAVPSLQAPGSVPLTPCPSPACPCRQAPPLRLSPASPVVQQSLPKSWALRCPFLLALQPGDLMAWDKSAPPHSRLLQPLTPGSLRALGPYTPGSVPLQPPHSRLIGPSHQARQ